MMAKYKNMKFCRGCPACRRGGKCVISSGRKDVLEKAYDKCGGYDESMHSGFEDWDFLSVCLKQTKTRI